MKRLALIIALGFAFSIILTSFAGVDENRLSDAVSKAKQGNKPLIIYFCGSDWCGSCTAFKKNVLNAPEVKQYLEANFEFYVADFPVRTKLPEEVLADNELLAEKFNRQAIYPKIVVVDASLTKLTEPPCHSKVTAGQFLVSIKQVMK